MNLKFWNRRYYTAAIYTLIVALTTITYWKSFESPRTLTIMPLLWPFIIGLALAYMLNFLLRLYERGIKNPKMALVLVYLTIMLLVLAFSCLLAPKISNTMEYFTEEFPDYSEKIVTQVKNYLAKFDLTQDHVATIGASMDVEINRFVTFNKNIVPQIIKHLVVITQTAANIILGVVLSAYILAKKVTLARQARLLLKVIAGEDKNDLILKWLKRADEIFTKFFSALALNSLIIGSLTVVTLLIFQIPFAILIGFIVATTNVIPIFGPLIGAIPSAIMIFFESPTKAVIFIIIILIIQQIDANFITPKVLGDKIGIAPIFVLISILVFGYFFGLIGTIIGVPITALLIEITRTIVYAKIAEKSYKKPTNVT